MCELRRHDGRTLTEWLRRPEVMIEQLLAWDESFAQLQLTPPELAEVEAEVKYAGYIARQQMEVERLRRMEDRRLPASLDYAAIPGLSSEARGRLLQRRPQSLGEASRIPGVRPVDVQLILVLLARGERSGPVATVEVRPDEFFRLSVGELALHLGQLVAGFLIGVAESDQRRYGILGSLRQQCRVWFALTDVELLHRVAQFEAEPLRSFLADALHAF